MQNTPNDSDYSYHFRLADGTIPPGAQFETREDAFAEVAGIPTQTGEFAFAVSVRADINAKWFGDDESDERIYTITIR